MKTRGIVSLIRGVVLTGLVTGTFGTAWAPGGNAQASTTALHVAATAPAGNDFTTSLSGTITGKNHKVVRTVSLDVSRTSDDKSVHLGIGIVNVGGLQSSYTFVVPASDLAIGNAGASLDTHAHLGKYGHISVRWTYVNQPATIQIPADSCFHSFARSITRIVASAVAQLNLTFPCEGSVIVALSGANLNLYRGQNVIPPSSSSSPGTEQISTSTSVGASKDMGATRLYVTASKQGKSAGIDISVSTGITASDGLVGISHFGWDALPVTGMTTGDNPAAKINYKGSLGTASLTFASTGTSTDYTSANCALPGVPKADRNRTISRQNVEATVTGSVTLSVCGAVKATFGSGDQGYIIVTGPATNGALPGSGTTGSYPSIVQISPPPGSPLSTAPTITATFAAAIPVAAHVAFTLVGPGGSATLPAAVVTGKTAAVVVDSCSPLKPGTYTLRVDASDNSSGDSYYSATVVVQPGSVACVPKATITPGPSPTPLPSATPASIVWSTSGGIPGSKTFGGFPPIVKISPAPGDSMTTTPTITLTFAWALGNFSKYMHFRFMLSPVDAAGKPTGGASAQFAAPVVGTSTISLTVSSALAPGTYTLDFLAVGVCGTGHACRASYSGTYTVS